MYFFPLFFVIYLFPYVDVFTTPVHRSTMQPYPNRFGVCMFLVFPSYFVCVSSARALSLSEENVWKLCEQVKKTRPSELSKCYAVFVSNEGRTVPLWRQKAGRGDDKVVIWVSDLHSIFLGFSCSLYDDYVPAPNTVAFKRSNSNIV